MFSPNDLEARRPVWQALSELFLDTELQPADRKHIALAIHESPYSLEQAEEILYTEVYPICIWNLASVAGEWISFPIDWLEERICGRLSGGFRIPVRFQIGRGMIREDWRKVVEALNALETRLRG